MAISYLRCDSSDNISWVASDNISLASGRAALAINSSTDTLYWVTASNIPISSDPVRFLSCDTVTNDMSWQPVTSYTFST